MHMRGLPQPPASAGAVPPTRQAQRIGPKNEGDKVDEAAAHCLHQHSDVVGSVLGGGVGQGLTVKERVHPAASLQQQVADGARLGRTAAGTEGGQGQARCV
jgi:hypothetical protein